MRVVVQRASRARLTADGKLRGEMGQGLVVLLGIERGDTPEELEWLCRKVAQLRIFEDEKGLMNKSVQEAGGQLMLVSQFTLQASTRKGNRPSYIRAARPEEAIPLYEAFAKCLIETYRLSVITGVFGAQMEVELVNDGPVTIIIDTKLKE